VAASLLGATGNTTIGLATVTRTSDHTDTITASGKTRVITGNTGDGTGTYFIQPKGNNVLYFGAVYGTAWNGAPVESEAGSFTATNVVVTVSSGSQTVFGGGASDGTGLLEAEHGGTKGKNLLVGAVSIYGGGKGDTLQAGAGTTYIKAASTGNATLIGGDANSAGNLADETLVGAATTDTFVFGSGNETLTGNGSTVKGHVDTFVDLNYTTVTASSGITITNFVHGIDKVDLFSLTNAKGTGATLTALTTADGNTTATLSDGVTITFAGVTNVGTSDFVTNVGKVQVGKIDLSSS
jgi:hypothetical protein